MTSGIDGAALPPEQALSRAETADEVARVVAEAGSIAAGAEFANIAVANLSAGRPGTANLYHASSLAEEVAHRYMVIPLDDSTPLGTVLRSGGEVWLRSLPDIGTRYPSLLEDTAAAGLAATASLALYGRGRRVIGAMGVAWAQPQVFTDAQRTRSGSWPGSPRTLCGERKCWRLSARHASAPNGCSGQ